MTHVLRIAHLRIAHQGAILRWAILTFTVFLHYRHHHLKCPGKSDDDVGADILRIFMMMTIIVTIIMMMIMMKVEEMNL